MSITLDIKLKKANKVYIENELVSGVVSINSKSDFKHDGIVLSAKGSVTMQLSNKNVGIIEAFYQSVKPLELVNCLIEIAAPGKIPAGKTDIPFQFPLKPKQNRTIYETYHGVFVSIKYSLRTEIKRSFLEKDIIKVTEITVEYDPSRYDKATPHPVSFTVDPNSLRNVREGQLLPSFLVAGRFDSTMCSLTKPFTGELVIKHCNVPIKSVELQLVRVETCGCAEGFARDATEIQNIQIGEGDVMCGLPIPVYMVFPRLFTCPTLTTTNFKVEFEVNVVVIFEDDHLITQNFPIILTRS